MSFVIKGNKALGKVNQVLFWNIKEENVNVWNALV
jgi:hypothetical protein